MPTFFPAPFPTVILTGNRRQGEATRPAREEVHMKRTLWTVALAAFAVSVWLMAQSSAQTPGDPLAEGFRMVEVASVADAQEQLYGQKTYMSHQMRPLAPTKFAGP